MSVGAHSFNTRQGFALVYFGHDLFWFLLPDNPVLLPVENLDKISPCVLLNKSNSIWNERLLKHLQSIMWNVFSSFMSLTLSVPSSKYDSLKNSLLHQERRTPQKGLYRRLIWYTCCYNFYYCRYTLLITWLRVKM